MGVDVTERAGATRRTPGGTWSPLAVALVVAVAYAVGAGCSWLLFHAAEVAVFYPPAGVTLGALLLTDRRRWPWILAAVALTEFGVDRWQGQAPWLAAGFALANTVEPLLGAGLLRRLRPAALDLTRPGDAVRFIACCVVAGPLLGAVIGAGVIALGMGRGWWGAFGPYWAGDGLAVLTLGAAITAYGLGGWPPAWRRAVRTVLVLVFTAALTVVGFWPQRVPLAYLPMPLLVATAFAGRVALVTAAGFVVAFVANVVSGTGHGPWAALASEPRLEAATLQFYLAVAVLTGWALAIGIAERDRARLTTRQEIAARRRLLALQEVTAGLATAATSTEIAGVLADHGVGLVADTVVVALQDSASGSWRTRLSDNFPAETAREFAEIPLTASESTPVTHAAASGRDVTLGSLEELSARYPRAISGHAEAGTRSLLAVPVRIGERTCGAIALGFAADREVDDEVTSVARTLAELTGQALERAELFEAEREAAHELQHALLPRIALDLPGVHAGVSYRPAQSGHDVGGDWYDVFEVPGNKVGFVVGDIVGHDLRAATAMGQLQTVVRSVALAGASPAELLEALDGASARIEGADCATVGYAEYSPAEQVLRYACAGHPPPLLLVDHQARYLDRGRSQLVGVPAGPRTQAQETVPPGALLVWYSDGLVERRGEGLDAGLKRLEDLAVTLVTADAQAFSDAVLAAMTAGHLVEDDVVVACLAMHGTLAAGAGSAVLRRTVRAPGELAATRVLLRTWAAAQHMSAEQVEALLLVCTEALTNALEHGHPGGEAAAELTVLRADHGHVRVEVSDQGGWQPSPRDGGGQGRGLTVISRLAQRATLDLRENGTRVVATLSTS